jgi:fermentation-respiration switch protein FrsA (DUF1100 family)
MRKSHTRSLILGTLAIAAAEIARRIFRHSQLLRPDPRPLRSWDPADYGIDPARVSMHHFEAADGSLLYGWYCRATSPVASALFCHGSTGNLTTVADVIPRFLEAGYHVLLFDYRGFGKSAGYPTISGILTDTVAAARLHDSIRPDGLPSILYGFSLGGAVAAQVALSHRFDGLILQSTFTTLPEIARVEYPRLPVRLLTGKLFDSVAAVRQLRIPLLILHGSQDEAIPCSMANALFEACSGYKQLLIVEEGLHNDLFTRQPDAVVAALNRFARGLTPGESAPLIAPGIVPGLADSALRFLRRQLSRRSPLTAKTL